MNVKKSLGLFRDLLNASWTTVLAFEEQYKGQVINDFKINWLQANWEMTVEQSVLQGAHFLQVYGEGADFGGRSSRVAYSDAFPTHQIICDVKNDCILLSGNLNSVNLPRQSTAIIFDSFATMTGAGWFEEKPPFDCVIANYGDTQVLFRFEDSEFSLGKLEQPLRTG